MTSAIDPAHPIAGQNVSKAALRANFEAAKSEIEALQIDGVDYDLVGRYGGNGNGSFDNTNAINNAFSDMSEAGHSRLVMRGRFVFDPAALAWPTAIPITLIVDGELLPSNTLVLTGQHNLIGVGGTAGTQFTRWPCCKISAPSGQSALSLQGGSGALVRGVYVRGNSSAPGVIIGHNAALKVLRDFSIFMPSGADAHGLEVRQSFWVWVENFVFNLDPDSTAYSCRIINDDPAIVVNSVLQFYRNGVLGTRGFLLETAAGTPYFISAIELDTIDFEASTQGSFVDTKLNGGSLINLRMINCQFDDTTDATFVQGLGAVGGDYIVFDACKLGVHITTGVPPTEIVWQGARPPDVPFDGDWPSKVTIEVDGETDGRNAYRNAEMSPGILSGINLGAKQDPAGWTGLSANFGIATDKLAPDGSSTAFEVTATTGAGVTRQSATIWRQGLTIADGDHLIIGIWAKSAVTEQAMNGESIGIIGINAPQGGEKLSGTVALNAGWRRGADMGWVPIVASSRYTGAGNPSDVYFQLWVTGEGKSWFGWKPFFIRLPAADWTRRDAARLAARLTIISQDQTTGGVLTQLPHQTFRTGRGETADRPSASAVGAGAQWYDAELGQPIWSNGTAWTDATGASV